MKPHGAATDARLEVERAVRQGDSSAATLLLLGELLAGAGRLRDAERAYRAAAKDARSEEHTSELQSQSNLVCRLLLEKKNSEERFVIFSGTGDAVGWTRV